MDLGEGGRDRGKVCEGYWRIALEVKPSLHGFEVKVELETIAELEPIKPH